MLDAPIAGAIAWRRADLRQADWLVPLGDEALAELEAAAASAPSHGGAIEDLTPDALAWPAVAAVLSDVRRRIADGVGFVVLDRLPVETWSETSARAVCWLLCNSLAPAVMQKWNVARRVYDVRDTGARLGYGVRRSVTNLQQDFHTDGPWLRKPASLMGLACVRQATDGGMSRVASFATVHNLLREADPALLARLYRPFYWDRQAEHAPGDTPASALPVFAWDGERLTVRYYEDYIRNGHRLMGMPLDSEGEAALALMRSIIEAPENSFEFRLQPGQLYFLDNRLLAHARTAFTEAGGDQATGRLLLRFWLRDSGGIGFEAVASAAPA